MTRPPFTADKNTLNAYIDHLEWKITHKDENIKSLSAQCEAYAKSMKRSHDITQNLIDNVTASLPGLSPVTSHVTLSEMKKNEDGTISPDVIDHGQINGMSIIHKGIYMSIPLYPGVKISQYQNILNVLKPEIIEETPEQNDIPTYKVIIILVVYVIICILIVILVSASKNK